MTTGAIYAELDRRAAQVADQVIQWRHHLHRHPELSNRESKTAAYITERLRSLHLDEVRTGIAGHCIAAVLRGGTSGDRTIALRADIDALPVPETCPAWISHRRSWTTTIPADRMSPMTT